MKVPVVISLVVVLMFSSIAMAAKDESLILFFSFEKVSGGKVVDESGNGNDGDISGDPKQVQGKFGQAMSFNGTTDWLTILTNDILNPDQITVMTWANPSVVAGCHRVFSKDDGSAQRNCELSFCDGTLEFAAWNRGGSRAIPSGAGVEASVWNHLAATFDGKNVVVYLNGEVLGQLPLEGELQNTDSDLIISRFTEGSEIYGGLLDDMAIFNRALTDDEIEQAMKKGISQQYVSVEPEEKLATIWSKVKADIGK